MEENELLSRGENCKNLHPISIDLRQGDCLELMKDIPDKSIDLILTDPPYNISRPNNFKTLLGGEIWHGLWRMG